jgi:drug/metabolite transporter (DMT)-like permease
MRNLSSCQKGLLALIIANIIWGAASPIFKLALQNIPPFTLAFLRFSIASLILFPFIHKELHDFTNEVRNWKDIIGYAITGVTINIIFFFLGLRLTTSITAPLIASSGPIILLVFAAIFLNEQPTAKKIAGAMVAFMGVVLLIIQPILDKGFDGSLIGNLFLLFATLGAVGQTIYGRKLAHKYSPLPLTFWAFLIGTITFIPLTIPEIINFPPLDYRGLTGIVFGAIFSSTIAYSLYTWGLSKIEASEAGLFAYIDPVIALLIAYPLLGERPTSLYLIGGALVFIGIFVAENRLNYHPLRQFFKNKV